MNMKRILPAIYTSSRGILTPSSFHLNQSIQIKQNFRNLFSTEAKDQDKFDVKELEALGIDFTSNITDDLSSLGVDLLNEKEPKIEEPLQTKEPLVIGEGGYGTGRRKTSVAKVWVEKGSGLFYVNGKRLHDYFLPIQRSHCLEPFLFSETAGLFDVKALVKGGGISGQAGAVRLGLARALVDCSEILRPSLSRSGMLTRDARVVERKKPGRHKARKQYQWVKR